MQLLSVVLIGVITDGGGHAIGALLLYLFKIKNPRLMGMLFGGTSGIMIAMICFDILPGAINSGKMSMVFIGMTIGMLIGLLMDESLPKLQNKLGGKRNELEKMGLILIAGLALHNLPEGFALGTVASSDIESLTRFATILCIHSIPEGIALAIPFRQGEVLLRKVLCINMVLGIFMGIGAVVGYSISGIGHNFISVGLGVASGIILYIVCQELMPESRKIWNGRMTTIATILGLMIGVFLIF